MKRRRTSPGARGAMGAIGPWIPYLLGTFTGLFLMAGVSTLVDRSEGDVHLYREVRDLVEEDFVRAVDRDALLDEALRGMVGGLDPYSRYYDAAEVGQLDRETSGTFTGIGVVFRVPTAERRVLFPVPGGPAASKLSPGDRLLAMDGVELSGLEPGEVQSRVAGSAGRSVLFDVESRDGALRQETLVPTTIVDPTVRHAAILDPELGIGYLAVLAFSEETPAEFDRETALLRERGMRSLIVDLRGNPGGVLQSAIALANRFVPEGDLVVTRSRHEARAYRAEAEAAELAGTPLVLLVDGDSASASEVLAGAIQDHRAGALVGEPTYGKGMVQTLQPYGKRAVVKITTSLYYTPANRQIDRAHTSECAVGIDPDLFVPVSREARARVHRHLATYSPPHELVAQIRRWEEEEGVLLLPSWPDDPQRESARALLSGRISREHGG